MDADFVSGSRNVLLSRADALWLIKRASTFYAAHVGYEPYLLCPEGIEIVADFGQERLVIGVVAVHEDGRNGCLLTAKAERMVWPVVVNHFEFLVEMLERVAPHYERGQYEFDLAREMKALRESLDQAKSAVEEQPDENHVPTVEPQKNKGGRLHYLEDIWAHEQVISEKRPPHEVYLEWEEKAAHRNQADPKRQWYRIIRPEWGIKR